MPDKDNDAEIQEILADLDGILSDISASSQAHARPATAPPQQPAAANPAPPPPAKEPPAVASAPNPDLRIELAPREGMMTPAPRKATPPPKPADKPLASQAHAPLEIPLESSAEPVVKPVAAVMQPPVKAPPPAVAAAPAAAEAPAPISNAIPEKVPKDQIRRVAIVHLARLAPQRELFVNFLDQSALTISKKPIYLRKVHSEVLELHCDAKAIVGRAKAAQAVALLALIEGLPEAEIQSLSEACDAAGISFRNVDLGGIQKRSLAVDIMVDMMLLPGES